MAGFAALVEAKSILEIGTHFGGSANAFLAGLKSKIETPRIGSIVTVDIEDRVTGQDFDPAIKRLVGNLFEKDFAKNVMHTLGKLRPSIAYIDALKDGGFLTKTIAAIQPNRFEWLILDDISTNTSMQRKWAELSVDGKNIRGIDISDVVYPIREAGYGMGLISLNSGAAAKALVAARLVNQAQTFRHVKVGAPYSYQPIKYEEKTPVGHDKTMPTTRGMWHFWKQPPHVIDDKQAKKTEKKPLFMVRPEELGVLHRLAKDVYCGDGEIVDAGTFLGASALALAQGLDERRDRGQHFKRIHSYDSSGKQKSRAFRPCFWNLDTEILSGDFADFVFAVH